MCGDDSCNFLSDSMIIQCNNRDCCAIETVTMLCLPIHLLDANAFLQQLIDTPAGHTPFKNACNLIFPGNTTVLHCTNQ